MGCARLTIVTQNTPTKLHCEYRYGTNSIDSPAADFFLSSPSDPLKRGPGVGTGHVGIIREPFFGEVLSLQTLPFGRGVSAPCCPCKARRWDLGTAARHLCSNLGEAY